MKENKLIT